MEDFKEHIPLIHTLCNPGLRDRHWEKVSEVVGFPLSAGPDLTLARLIDLNLTEYISKFEGISEGATKEHTLEKTLEKMIAEWSEVEFNMTAYR